MEARGGRRELLVVLALVALGLVALRALVGERPDAGGALAGWRLVETRDGPGGLSTLALARE